MSFNDTQSTGILLLQAGAGTVVDDNDINGNDIGVYSWGSGLTIINNRLGQSAANRFEGIVVDEGTTNVTDNTINGGNVGVLVVSFSGNSLDSEAILSGNAITGAGIGVQAADGSTATACSRSSRRAATRSLAAPRPACCWPTRVRLSILPTCRAMLRVRSES